MCSEELGICDGIFEGSVIVHLFGKNIVVESGIRYVFFVFVRCLVPFPLGLELGLGLGLGFWGCTYVQQLGLGLGLGLG